MTEQKEPSAIPEDKVASETSVTEKPQSQRDSGKKLAVLAIIVALAAGAASAGYIRHLDRTQMAENQLLSAELTQLRHQSANDRQQLTAQLNQTEEALRIAQQQQDASAKTLDALKEKVVSLTGDNSSVWLVAQADYLVKLAGRKLWSVQDVTTAIALLKSADHSLADINDPSILNIRRALTHDISTLSNLNQVDYDGLILQLNQLSNDIDGLQLADDNDNSSPMDADSREISGSLAQWRQNLVNSWHDFMDNFITIRRRDTTAQPLLAPNQNIYLRENIRSKLLIAAQAVPRHQQEIYKQSLEAVSTWVRSWYSAEDPATKAFLSQTEQLEQQPVVMDLPETLDSQPLIDKLMQVRVRGLMSQPAAAMPETAKQQGG